MRNVSNMSELFLAILTGALKKLEKLEIEQKRLSEQLMQDDPARTYDEEPEDELSETDREEEDYDLCDDFDYYDFPDEDDELVRTEILLCEECKFRHICAPEQQEARTIDMMAHGMFYRRKSEAIRLGKLGCVPKHCSADYEEEEE